jgi:hypothetical protein
VQEMTKEASTCCIIRDEFTGISDLSEVVHRMTIVNDIAAGAGCSELRRPGDPKLPPSRNCKL